MQIDIWSDFACPWCALGSLRLRAALDRFEHGDEVTVVHRAFELHPGSPARVERSMEEVVRAKYGMSAAQVRAGHDRLTEMGRDVGFTFDFDTVKLGNTFDAHRLAAAVRGTPAEQRVVDALFVAHFTEGRQLSDHAVLRDVGESAGLTAEAVTAALVDVTLGTEVRADEAEAVERDVTGVPYFLVAGVWPIPGAQDVDTLLAILQRAWSRLAQ